MVSMSSLKDKGVLIMDIRVLQYFLAVAQEGSITKAAASLHMTQTPLSRQLKELETEVGKVLFIRGNKNIVLTEEGKLLQKRAEQILCLVEKTKNELSAPDTEIAGGIFFDVCETEGMSALEKTLRRLHKKHPSVFYHILSGSRQRVLDKLNIGLVDFGLVVDHADTDKCDSLLLPYRDSWGVVLRSDDPLAFQSVIKREDILNKPLILSNQASGNKALMNWLQTDISNLNVVIRYDMMANAGQFVRNGFGYAISINRLINLREDRDLCFRPLEPELETDVYLIWKKNQGLSRAASAFLELLKEDLETDGSGQ